jgi:hypothetical protein
MASGETWSRPKRRRIEAIAEALDRNGIGRPTDHFLAGHPTLYGGKLDDGA